MKSEKKQGVSAAHLWKKYQLSTASQWAFRRRKNDSELWISDGANSACRFPRGEAVKDQQIFD
jgi:hypothetical protein